MVKNLSYFEKHSQIKSYIDFSFPKRKKSDYSRSEKILITKYYNYLRYEGFLRFSHDEASPKIKFVRSKKKKLKGAPRVKGYFVKGADKNDKIKDGKIYHENFIKTRVPIDFSDFPMDDDEYFDDFIIQRTFEALTPYFEQLNKYQYFSIYLQNGWELGRGAKTKVKKAQKFNLDYDDIDEIFQGICDKLIDIMKRGMEGGQSATNNGKALVSGIYLWQFTNQRKPSKKELSAIKGKKRGNKGRKKKK